MSMMRPSLTCVSFSYERLPQELSRLSILKLNGSFFEVEVPTMATVGELKQAVENVFRHSPEDDMHNISWWHVWSQFCLSFNGQKLVDDKAYIQSFGIKDGDQLYFVRHSAINSRSSANRQKRALTRMNSSQFRKER